MTAPPLPTFIPQDAWYTLTTGQISPSEADTVPNITYLHPSLQNVTLVDGLVGSADEDIIYLAGLKTRLDGGQKFLMWASNSLAVDDGVNTFCPFVDVTKPGRWLNTGTTSTGPGVISSTQIITAGGTKPITAASTIFVNVFVKGRSQAGATTLPLPGSTFQGQTIYVKGANGDEGASNLIITAPSIDGRNSDTLVSNYAERTYVWNGTEWSAR